MHVIDSMVLKLGRAAGFLAAFGMASAACARDAEREPSALPPDGAIIYARDVHHSIGQRHSPGQEHATVTAPAHMIVDSIGLGLQPLEDEETASVFALLSAPQAGVAALPDLTQRVSASGTANQLSVTEVAGPAINSAIDNSMGALSQALGALSAILGANQ